MKNHDNLNCQPEHQSGNVDPTEFFIFKTGIVWCNVFKSASTSILYIMGLLDGMSEKKLRSMNPLVSEMRNIYGRPKLDQIMAASISHEKNIFIVKRHPFKRLISGFKEKILQSRKNTHHDKMSQKILEKYRGLPKRKYKHRMNVPTFSEFIEYVLDIYDKNKEIDMHWAPVVVFAMFSIRMSLILKVYQMNLSVCCQA